MLQPWGGTEALAAEAETVSETTETTSITITPANTDENPAQATITDTVTEEEVQDKILDEVDTGSTILNSDNTSAGILQEDDTIIDENGNTVTESVITQTDDNTYVGTAQQTETNTETNETTTTTTTVTATVEEGTLEVTGTWEGTSSGEDDGKLENVDTLGPSEELVSTLKSEVSEDVWKAYEEAEKAYEEASKAYSAASAEAKAASKAKTEAESALTAANTEVTNAKRAQRRASSAVTQAQNRKISELEKIYPYDKATYGSITNWNNYIKSTNEYKESLENDTDYQDLVAALTAANDRVTAAKEAQKKAEAAYDEADETYKEKAKISSTAKETEREADKAKQDAYSKMGLTPDEDNEGLYYIDTQYGEEVETDTDQPLTLTGSYIGSSVPVGFDGSYTVVGYDYTVDGDGNIVSKTPVQRQSFYNDNGKIFELVDENGKTYYAYCADKETPQDLTTGYDIVNVYDKEGMDDNTAAHITYIVTNGYWGEENTAEDGEEASVGSLDYVKKLAAEYAKDNDLTIDVSKINGALAMSATQAAIWAYTNPDVTVGSNQTILDKGKAGTLFLNYWKAYADAGLYSKYEDLTDDEKAAACALFMALYNENLDTADYKDESTDIIQEEDIKSVTISNLDKVDEDEMTVEALTKLVAASLDDKNEASASDSAKKLLDDTAAGSELYTGDVTLTVAVVKDRINSDNLKVYIFADDVFVAVKSFADITEMEDDGNGNTNFTVTNVVLPTGKNIRIKLSGEQNIEGAYLYQSTVGTSQTLVGLIAGEAERTVDIDVTIKFDVEGNGSVIRTDKVTTTTTPSTPDGTTPETTITDEDTPLTDIPDDVTDIEDEDTPLAEGVEIADSDVPMADVPETGDSVNGWYLMTVFSALGLLWIAIDSKKRKAAESK